MNSEETNIKVWLDDRIPNELHKTTPRSPAKKHLFICSGQAGATAASDKHTFDRVRNLISSSHIHHEAES